MNEGWIKLYRKFDEWEWFNISEMVHLFIYLLLNANHEEGEWRGVKIKRGQILTGLNKLNAKTKISIRTLRTCLDRLRMTGEIDIRTTNQYSIISILNYDNYQGLKQTTDKQPDKPPTSDRQATDNKQEEIELNNEENNFDAFWNAYDKKEDRVKCEKKWKSLKNSEREACMKAVSAYVNFTPDKQYRKNPATYLNNKSWENEIKGVVPIQAKTVARPYMDPTDDWYEKMLIRKGLK